MKGTYGRRCQVSYGDREAAYGRLLTYAII